MRNKYELFKIFNRNILEDIFKSMLYKDKSFSVLEYFKQETKNYQKSSSH